LIKLVIVLCILSLLFRLIFVYKFHYKFHKHKVNHKTKENFFEAVSVIISAKNEADNLKKNLPIVLGQNYINYEVIVVDDYSTDDTLNILKEIQKKHPQLSIITKDNFEDRPGKKAALAFAIKKAKNDILLFTDADCYPNSKDWLKQMSKHFGHDSVEIVLGYAPYIINSNSLLDQFIQFETYKTALSYFGFALNNDAYMGVGRNLAYRKSSLKQIEGFKSHENIVSGDDDLTIIALANDTNVAIEYRKDSWCFSKPENTFKSYVNQKNRHVSTAKYYPQKIKVWLFLYAFFHLTFYLSSFYFLFFGFYFFLMFYFFYIVLLRFEYLNTTNKLINNSLFRSIFLMDFVFIFYYCFTFCNAFFKLKNNKW